jgi:YD repeat-containing protein
LGNEAGAEYDGFLRLTRLTSPGSGSYSYSFYPNSNQLRTYMTPSGEVGRVGADTSAGDVLYDIDPRNEKRRADGLEYIATIDRYDAAGNLTSEEVNRYAAGTDLDQRPLPAPLATLRQMSLTYDTGGLVTSKTDLNGNITHFGYDTLTGYLIRIDAPAGSGEANADGSPKRRVTTMTRHSDGSVTSTVDPKGQKTTYGYDGLGRLTRISFGMQDGAADSSTSYTLDPNGNMTGMTDEIGSSSWVYDEDGNLTIESRTQNGVTKTAGYSHYADGLLKELTTFDGKVVTYGYDSALQLVSQTDPNNLDTTGKARAITYSYNGQSRTRTTTFPGGIKQEVTYDIGGREDLIALKNSDGTLLQSFKYDYGLVSTTNPDGTVTVSPGTDYRDGFVRSVTEADDSRVTYDYDDFGRLVSARRTGTFPYSQSYAYDANNTARA